MNAFTRRKAQRQIEVTNVYSLITQALQVNFNATDTLVVEGPQSKSPQIKVCAQFAIDALEFVYDEGSCYSERIVVGSFKRPRVLLHIRPDQQGVALSQHTSNCA